MANTLDDTSVYPDMIDGYATLPLRRNQIHEIRAEDVNRLRNAIIRIEQELGVQPSGTFATVADRLDEIGDAKTLILAHIADPEDAHDASAISVLDEEDNYFSENVEDVLEELAPLLPPRPDEVGKDNSKVPNDGIPSFVDGYGPKFFYNLNSTNTITKRTQPEDVRGLHVFDISNSVENGIAELRVDGGVGTETLEFRAPGDSTFGNAVDIWQLNTGDFVTVFSSDTTKAIRVARGSDPLPLSFPTTETFEVFGVEFVQGTFSLNPSTEGFKFTRNITRTALSSTDPDSRLQFVIDGMVFPADRGTLVLQRKLRGTAQFFPIAVLDLNDNFNEDLRRTGQPVYVPTLENFDVITLYDRLPVSEDYSLFTPNANGNDPYEDFENTFSRLQVAKYRIPVSNSDIIGGELEALDENDISLAESNDKISAYRLVHYREGVTDFNGEPDPENIFSFIDTEGNSSDGDSTTRFSNVYIDVSPTRPGIEHIRLRPTKDGSTPAESLTSSEFVTLSGINYYNNESTNKFQVALRSDNNVFNRTYIREGILQFETNAFDFPNGVDDGIFGASVDVDELFDGDAPGDGYLDANKYAANNLPNHKDQAFYIIDNDVNPTRRPVPAPNVFTNQAFVTGTFRDPFGPGDGYTATGYENVSRILINTYSQTRATDTKEWFTDESKRVATSFNFDERMIGFADSYVASYGFSNASALSPGELQCGARFDTPDLSGLIFPQDNYTSNLVPINTGFSADYSSASYNVDSIYQRQFSLGYPISKGKLRITSGGERLISFDDIRASNPNRLLKIEVKIPGKGTDSTGFLDIGKLFETGKFENGDGALSGLVTGSSGDFTVPFTFGGRNNADTNNFVAVRVTYFDSNIEEVKKITITSLELLGV